MRHLTLIAAFSFLVAQIFSGPVPTSTSYTDSLAGEIVPPGSSSLSLGADASGSLPGSFTVSLNLNGATISSGSWWLVVKQRNADGSTSEVGALTGVVSDGTVGLNANGNVTSLDSVHLNIRSGNGSYNSVTEGTGVLQGTLNQQTSPVFSGTLTLTF